MTTVLYSAIYGEQYDTVKPVHGHGADRAVLFTDNPALVGEAGVQGWDLVAVEPLQELPSPMLRAKWWKTRADLAVPDADVTLWIDGSMTPYPDYAGKCLDALGDLDMALTPHPWRDCIYDEVEASFTLPKYDDAAMHTQVDGYWKAGHPQRWGLFASGAIARRHTRPVHEFGRLWWEENLNGSWQDQLSLPVVLRRCANLRWAATLPWATWWGLTDHGVGFE